MRVPASRSVPQSIRRNLPGAAARACLCLAAALLVSLNLTGAAAADPISSQALGVEIFTATSDGQLDPSNLQMASSAGLGVVRKQVIEGTNADPVVALAASAHLRLAPMLGLPCPSSYGSPTDCPESASETPGQAASDMASYVTAFEQRYGPNGTFWAANPTLPYLPVESYEIGNEPNMPLQWVADDTHLHWTDPADYAQVYEAARAALHQVDPSAVAVVGGLADSGADGVDVQSDEQWLAALTAGTVDAVGYHPYTFDVSDSLMATDTQQLRQWMDANGFASVPLDVNEFDACQVTSSSTTNLQACPADGQQDSQTWGTVAAEYTEWALCTPGLNVGAVMPFYWGDTPTSDGDVWLTLTTTAGSLTSYGQQYLAVAQTLTRTGCPAEPPPPPGGWPPPASPPPSSPPPTTGAVSAPAPGPTTAPEQASAASLTLAPVTVRVARSRSHLRVVTVTTRILSEADVVAVVATRGHRRVSLHRRRRRHRHGLAVASRLNPYVTFIARLRPGRWTITVLFRSRAGSAVVRRTITIRA
jgi:hypothetical protein